MKFVQPSEDLDSFTCPTCGVLAQQFHRQVHIVMYSAQRFDDMTVRQCGNCSNYTIWFDSALVVPERGGFAPPNSDLSDDIRRDYDEAASIADRSPRGAAALLRLCVQKLCRELGYNQDGIDNAIAAMVTDGLPVQMSQALDVVRVVGNNAVHPGVIDLRDDMALVRQLAALINLIAENRISEPRLVNELFDKLPETTRVAIEARNAKALPAGAEEERA